MGGIIGGVIGGIGSLFGGSKANKAAQQSLTGFNYLKGSPIGKQYVPTGGTANDMVAQLLGAAPLQQGTSNAFSKYLDSTGYQFQLGEGQRAITSSDASKGILNSGAQAKALAKYGQGLAGNAFQQYIANLGGLSTQGLQAGQVIGAAGTSGGSNAANLTAPNTASMYGNAFGALSDIAGSF